MKTRLPLRLVLSSLAKGQLSLLYISDNPSHLETHWILRVYDTNLFSVSPFLSLTHVWWLMYRFRLAAKQLQKLLHLWGCNGILDLAEDGELEPTSDRVRRNIQGPVIPKDKGNISLPLFIIISWISRGPENHLEKSRWLNFSTPRKPTFKGLWTIHSPWTCCPHGTQWGLTNPANKGYLGSSEGPRLFLKPCSGSIC